MEKLRETQPLVKVTWGAEMNFKPRCVQLEITLQASDTAPMDRRTHTDGHTHSPVGDTAAVAGGYVWGAAGGVGEAGGVLAAQGLQVPGWQAGSKALHLNHVASI